MNGPFTWFTGLWGVLAVPILDASETMIGALQAYVLTWFPAAAGAYLMAMLLIAAWSDDNDAARGFFRSLFLAAIVYTIATSAGAFDYYVTGFSNGIVNGITAAVNGVFGGSGPVDSTMFDTIANKILAVGVVTLKHIPPHSIVRGIILGFIVDIYAIFSVIVLMITFGIWMLSKILLGFLIGFGPLFIACYFFPFTMRFFNGWLSVVVAGMLTQVFVASAMAMFAAVITWIVGQYSGMLTGGNGGIPGGDIINEIIDLLVTVAACGLFLWLVLKLSALAQSIAGGAHAQFSRLPSFSVSSFGSLLDGGKSSSGSESGGNAGSAGSPDTGTPPRFYLFLHTVGSAP